MFDQELDDVVEECGWDVGDVRSILSEHYNNEVLDIVWEKHGPQFDHSCAACIFLGRWNWTSPDGVSGEADLYICPNVKNPADPIFSVRWGDDDLIVTLARSTIEQDVEHRDPKTIPHWYQGHVEALNRWRKRHADVPSVR